MPVDPGQLAGVEHSRTVADLREIEPPCHLVDRHELFVLARRPAKQRQIVDERFGQIPALAELGDARRAVALRERRVIRPEHEREMRKSRRTQPERLVQEQLPRRVGDVVLASDDVTDLHRAHRRRRPRSCRRAGRRTATITGSPMTSVLNVTTPRTRSLNVTSPRSGTAKRSAAGSPAATRAAAAAGSSARHRPLYRGGCPVASARCRSASSSSAVQKQQYARPRSRSVRAAAAYCSLRSDCRYGAKGPPTSGPSSQSSPSQRKSSRMARSDARLDRSVSVSSMRRTNAPPARRASSQLKSAVRALPTCRCPVGLGANRTRAGVTVQFPA